MNQENPTCPKCNSEMESGFIIDHEQEEAKHAMWHPGKPIPRKSFKTQVDKMKLKLVTSYRCVACGYLESYAK